MYTPSQQFLADRERGRPAQEFVAGMFRSFGGQVEVIPDGFFQAYDLSVNGHTIEVKYDIRAAQTGNFALELDALFHSKAEWLAIVVDNLRTVYLTPLQEALKLAQAWPDKRVTGERSEVS